MLRNRVRAYNRKYGNHYGRLILSKLAENASAARWGNAAKRKRLRQELSDLKKRARWINVRP